MDLIWQEMSGIPFFGNPKIWSVRSHVAKGSQSRCCLVWFEEIQPLNLATCLEGKQWCSTGGQRLHLELDLQLNITSIYVYLYFARYLKKFHRHFPHLRIPPWNIARNVARFFLRSSASASVRSKPMLICRITTAWRRGISYPDMTVKFHVHCMILP